MVTPRDFHAGDRLCSRNYGLDPKGAVTFEVLLNVGFHANQLVPHLTKSEKCWRDNTLIHLSPVEG